MTVASLSKVSVALVVVASLAVATAGGQTVEEPARAGPGLPSGVLARVNGRDISVREYADYLLASIGTARLGEYIDRLLQEEEARRLGIAVNPEEVEKLVDERISRTISGLYQGERERYLEELAKRQSSLEEEKAHLRQRLYYDLLLEKVILKERKLTEDRLRKEFERLYGPGGVQYEFRHILVSTARRTGAGGEQLPVRSEAEAEERAAKIRHELLAGADFVQLVKRYSDDTFTRENDGRVPNYREGDFGKEFHQALAQLTRENPLSGVVRSRRGLHLLQLIERTTTRLEDVREEVESVARNRPASEEERHETILRLRQAAQIAR